MAWKRHEDWKILLVCKSKEGTHRKYFLPNLAMHWFPWPLPFALPLVCETFGAQYNTNATPYGQLAEMGAFSNLDDASGRSPTEQSL